MRFMTPAAPFLIGALQHNARNGVCVEHALLTLCKFIAVEDSGAAELFYKEGIVELCLAAVTGHSGQLPTLTSAVHILKHIVACKTYEDDPEKVPVLIKTVRQVMLQCIKEPEIMKDGLSILHTLLNVTQTAAGVIETGALDVLVEAMREYPV